MRHATWTTIKKLLTIYTPRFCLRTDDRWQSWTKTFLRLDPCNHAGLNLSPSRSRWTHIVAWIQHRTFLFIIHTASREIIILHYTISIFNRYILFRRYSLEQIRLSQTFRIERLIRIEEDTEDTQRGTWIHESNQYGSVHPRDCRGKPVVCDSYVPESEIGLRGRQCLKMRKRGPDRAPSWWWQYKARRVAGLSQSVSGTYTFKVRVLEGKLVPDLSVRLVCRRFPVWASRATELHSRISLVANRGSAPALPPLPAFVPRKWPRTDTLRRRPTSWSFHPFLTTSVGLTSVEWSRGIQLSSIESARDGDDEEDNTFPVKGQDEHEVLAGAALGSSFRPCRWVPDFSATSLATAYPCVRISWFHAATWDFFAPIRSRRPFLRSPRNHSIRNESFHRSKRTD